MDGHKPSGSSILSSIKEFITSETGLQILVKVLGTATMLTVSYYTIKLMRRMIEDIDGPETTISQKFNDYIDHSKLNRYERSLASQALIFTPDLQIGRENVGGLNDTLTELEQTVVFPLTRRFDSKSELLQPFKGLLLYGPPGCGKTLVAKYLAKVSNSAFLGITPNFILDKYVGESEKRISALFSLARKCQPCIIFIDEVDCLLKSRDLDDVRQEHMDVAKSLFMQFWDGFTTSDDSPRVLIIGASNRAQDIDPAFLRRMPRKFFIPVPNATQREQILKAVLLGMKLAADVCLKEVANSSDGFTGSDLKEACRYAVLNQVKDFDENDKTPDIELCQADLVNGIAKLSETYGHST